MYLIQNVH
jgi:hypothetical protein